MDFLIGEPGSSPVEDARVNMFKRIHGNYRDFFFRKMNYNINECDGDDKIQYKRYAISTKFLQWMEVSRCIRRIR